MAQAPLTVQDKIKAFHSMCQQFYDPETNQSNLLPVDKANINNPQYIGEFVADNQIAMQKDCLNSSKYPGPNCMGTQEEINVKMRRILVDWLTDVHMKFKLVPETLFITINMVDRYTENK